MLLVYLAYILVMLLGMAALVIDTGHLYITRAQLQNAADAGALAGAAALDGSASFTQAAARAAAGDYAGKNIAAGKSVLLDLNYANRINGDIVVGCWSTKTTPPSIDITASCGRPDAIKIKARRSSDAGSGPDPVKTVFARILKMNEMNVGATAIAYRPHKQTDKITLVK